MRDWTPELQKQIDNRDQHTGVEVEDGNEYCNEDIGGCGVAITPENQVDDEAIKGVVPKWLYEVCAECASNIEEGKQDDEDNRRCDEERESRYER